MKRFLFFSAVVLAGVSLAACADTRVQRVAIPSPSDQSAYVPIPMIKPMPGEVPPGYQGQPGQPMGQPGQPGQLGPVVGQPMPPVQALPNEPAFVQFYTQHRSPKIMIFVNRTIQGDPLPKDALQQVINTPGPAVDVFGASDNDYQMVELSMVQYFLNSGRVAVADSETARQKLNREQILRIENGDPAAARLLSTELQQDILIRINASPTRQAGNGQPAVRLTAKAVSTADANILAVAMVDMPLPMSKTTINVFTSYLSNELMGQMAQKWSMPAAMNPIEVRIYKVASIDDGMKIGDWLKATDGVSNVRMTSGTGGSATAYTVFAVGYDGAPSDLYGNLKASIGQSQGIKAVDLTNSTINLEVTGQMLQLTTTRRSQTKTTVETTTTEDKKVEPINPAPPQ